MEEGKILQIYARIRNEDEIEQISKECERRGIAKSDFVLEAVELHLMNNKDLTPMIDARDKAERSLEASREIREGLEKDIVQLEADLAKANDTNNELERQNGDLKVARQSNANQRDKFKQKLEEVVQTHEKLISEVREMQSRGVFARASKLKRFNTAKYVIKTEEDNETSA